jgi:quinol monooxygenase YgiN
MSDASDPRRILYAEFTAVPGGEAKVAELVRGLVDLVRQEPGNIVFAASRKQSNSAEFFVYEEYADAEAFTAHRGAAYGAEFNAKLADLVVGGRSELTFLEPL